MSTDKKESIFRKVLIHALVTATGIIVTFFVTDMIKQTQFNEQKNKQAIQRAEASKVTNQRLNENIDYKDKYENLLEKLLLDKKSTQPSTQDTPDDISIEPEIISIGGQWFSPDGAESWNFSENRMTVSGIGAFSGSIKGTGTFNMTSSTITGEIQLTIFLWIPSDVTFTFRASVNRAGNTINGSLEDNIGQITPLMLYK